MTLGLAPRQADLFRSTAAFCEGRVAPGSIYGILHRECFALDNALKLLATWCASTRIAESRADAGR